jgi:hypothetical protein
MDIANGVTLQNILMNQYIDYESNYIKSKDIVFVLDEFDTSIQFLNAKKKIVDNNKINYNNEIEKIITNIRSDIDDNDKDDKKLIKKLDKISENMNNDDDFTLEHLLTILQGPCANNGSIIIATTNKYHTIKNICPRLFRDGRLTPYHFGYPCKSILNEITKYYFDVDIMNHPDYNELFETYSYNDTSSENEENTQKKYIKISQSKILNKIIRLLIINNDDKEISFIQFTKFIKKELLKKITLNLDDFDE